MQDESIPGTILTGYATNNEYTWEGNKKWERNRRIKNFKGWEANSYKSVFIYGDAETICSGERA